MTFCTVMSLFEIRKVILLRTISFCNRPSLTFRMKVNIRGMQGEIL